METKLQGIPRWHLRSAVQHKDIRLIEQASFKKALLADRAVWLIVDWGLGKEGFLFSTLHTEEDQHVEVFRLNCEEVSSVETLTSETQKQFQLTFQELCLYLSALPSSYLILDNLPEPTTTLQTEGWFDCLDEIVQAAVDLASTIRIVLTSRRVPTTSKFNMVHIRPLEEPECARYIAAHPEGGPDLLGMRGVERLYAKSQGIPMHLDRMLTELHTISIDELSILEQEGTIETPQIEPVPRALVQAISILQHSTDKYTGRSLRLLKVLTILSQGETLESVRKFDPIEPLYPQNAEELRTLGLIEAIPLVTPGLQLGQHNTVARIDAASPKLLIVPRQVRDYVHSVITEEEHHSIVERSLEIYFGPQWREGKISLLPASKLRVREGIAGGPGNPYIVTLLMLRTALTRGDEVLFLQVFRLVDSYLTALNEADRFRDMYTISQEVFHLLESTGKKPEVAKVAYRYGYSLRMLGHHEESIRILEAPRHV